MKSMTGYGRAGVLLADGALEVQVSSVNRRGLEITVRLPDGWEGLESAVIERVRPLAARGKVHVAMELATAGGRPELSWNEADVHAVLDRLETLAEARGVPFAPTPELLWQVANAQRTTAGRPEADSLREPVLAAVDEALRAFSAMRAREGEALLVDFLERSELLRRHLDAIAARAPEVAPAHRALLLKRLREAGLDLDVDDERVLKELALFADRCDVSEEVTRFRSHLSQLGGLLRSEGEIGRKADFLLQELGREANTIGSKANDLAIARSVIELKNELERVREQLANVE
jgi:uncharacterized protein (TIGR00255 family)